MKGRLFLFRQPTQTTFFIIDAFLPEYLIYKKRDEDIDMFLIQGSIDFFSM